MQASMQMVSTPLARLQRPLRSGLVSPAGLAPLRRPVPVARHRPAAVRAQLEDALGSAADGASFAFHNLAAHLSTALFLLGDAADQMADAAGSAAGAAAASDAASAAAAAASSVVSAAADAVASGQAADAVVQVADDKNSGFFGAFASAFEAFLKVLDDGLEKFGVPYSYGFAIILLTFLVKVATYPLTKKQVESTLSMQALQPKVKELQAKYANDPERLQVETARVYQTAGVNPLAGCLPALATIPVFIGLYKALSNVADEGLLSDGFFWIPSLAGPTTVNGGLGWLFSWQNGAPELGWADTGAYLVLPVLLVVSQYWSQKVISPPQSNDPAQQQTQAILKFLPLMIGYFSLNVPSGLTLYWFTNNLVTTAQQLYLRNKFAPAAAAAGASVSGPASSAVIDVEPVEKKPSGKELNARRSSKAAGEDDFPPMLPGSSSSSSSSGGGGGSRGEKFRAIKAREAAAKAAAQAAPGAPAAAAAAALPAPERGAKFRALKEKEATAKADEHAAPLPEGEQEGEAAQAGSSNGAAVAPAAAAAPPAEAASNGGAAVAVVAEVIAEPEPASAKAEADAPASAEVAVEAEVVAAPAEEQQHSAAAQEARAAAPAPKAKKGGKKGGKKK